MAARPDSTTRFANRVDDYVRGRPGYPLELIAILQREAGLRAGQRIADLGCGTGLSSELFLDRGYSVVGIERQAAMRAAADRRLSSRPGWSSVDGRAEATGLAEASVHWVVAFQAFHWFDPSATRRELLRILVPGGRVALVWNARRATGSPLLEDYERLLERHGRDYRQVGHRGLDVAQLAAFFGTRPRHARLAQTQPLDLDGLRARLLSSSYVPQVDEPGADAMLSDLDALFARHQTSGEVALEYDVDLWWGELHDPAAAGEDAGAA